ncbi:PQQ-like beta-propeller repeat protein (plasmid) [Halarchaeum sp. CBA1220]|uniref:outer membrane protein assembly factor BamB family protein n=1 Tax=Halarchaeum sp. CBA1220 TaxID=1853682 RepID=UPI000F3A885D|nr:PQQ-binding-like beta-propeller repeat protein [Halarchaeum sp. CBA1220]QLC34909.1 PQQ-like beta-propeller repeat protein [Halarchaeum sp. CBA1220]
MTTRSLALAAAVVATVLLAGCTGVPLLDDGDDFDAVWHSDTPANPGGTHHPAIATRIDGEAYIATGFGDVGANRSCSFVVLNGTGGVRWNESLPTDACGTQPVGDPAFGDVTGDGAPEVVWATHEQRLYASNPRTGAEVLNVSFPSGVPFAQLVVVEDPTLVVVPLMAGQVRAYHPNGTLAWNRTFPDYVRGQGPALVTREGGARELVLGTGGGLVALDPTTGETDWRTETPTRFLRTGRLGDTEVVVASGANAAGTAGEGDTHVEAVAANGTRLWERHYPGTPAVGAVGAPAPGARTLAYATNDDGRLYAYDLASGREVWNRTLDEERRYVPPPTLADLDGDGDEEVVAAAAYGPVSAFNASTGAPVGTWSWDGDAAIWAGLRSADVDGDGDEEVLAVTTDAQVVALGD